MATVLGRKPPMMFWVVATVLLIWGLFGCASFYMHIAYGPDMDPNATDWDRAFFNALPAWLNIDFAIAVGAGVIGAVALLLRSRVAGPLFLLSLVGIVIQFGFIFLFTDLIAHKGAATVVPFPVFIAAMAVFEIWFAGFAQKRGWIS